MSCIVKDTGATVADCVFCRVREAGIDIVIDNGDDVALSLCDDDIDLL